MSCLIGFKITDNGKLPDGVHDIRVELFIDPTEASKREQDVAERMKPGILKHAQEICTISLREGDRAIVISPKKK